MYSYQSLIVPVYALAARHSCAHAARRVAAKPPSFTAVLTWFHLFATVWLQVTWLPLCFNLGRGFATLSRQILLNKDRQCCESWRDAELGVCAVCAVVDTTDEDRWVDLLCCLPHCDTAESSLTNDTLTTFSSSHDCYGDWRRPSPTVCRHYDASSPFRRCRLLRSFHNASPACACCMPLPSSYVFLVTFSVLYYVTDSFSLFYLLVFPYTLYWTMIAVLTLNYRITLVIKVTFWLQSCKLSVNNSKNFHTG